ncbi:hypothetical protein [Streptomyces sp. NPDC057301]|uniref:hypothetical protein n=1 Tax=Streptomyces sp. NPDC057301 TaxID=3346093 RepID=UPI003636960A
MSTTRALPTLQRRDTHHAPCALDEALERLHLTGPEWLGRLTNHAPMVVEAPAARGRSDAVRRWPDLYERQLEEFPAAVAPIPVPDGRRRWATRVDSPRAGRNPFAGAAVRD